MHGRQSCDPLIISDKVPVYSLRRAESQVSSPTFLRRGVLLVRASVSLPTSQGRFIRAVNGLPKSISMLASQVSLAGVEPATTEHGRARHTIGRKFRWSTGLCAGPRPAAATSAVSPAVTASRPYSHHGPWVVCRSQAPRDTVRYAANVARFLCRKLLCVSFARVGLLACSLAKAEGRSRTSLVPGVRSESH